MLKSSFSHTLCLMFFSSNFQDRLNENPFIAAGPSITIERVERLNGGIYQCIAENGVREPVSSFIQLIVLCEYII